MRKLKYLDLFAGCGGLSDGFEQTGRFQLVAAVEWEKKANETFMSRIGKKWKYRDAIKRVLCFDIQKTDKLIKGWRNDSKYGSGEGLEVIIRKSKGVDLIIGGPPCQAYSIAGRVRDEHGMHNDYRNYLFESYMHVVRHFKPEAFVFENVPGILSAAPGGIPIVERIRKAFSRAGYEIVNDLREMALLDLKMFGIPQDRKRVILVGIQRKSFKENSQKLLEEFYCKILTCFKSNKLKTVSDAIGDLPPIYPAKSDYRLNGRRFSHEPANGGLHGHIPRYHNRRDIDIFRELAQDIKNGKNNYSIDRIKRLYTERTGKVSNVHKYYVLRWNRSSNTIPAHLYKDGLRHIHPDPEQARSITIREAARLQTFDDDFEFSGSLGDQYKMIGNAVPPVFAGKLAEALSIFLKRYSRHAV
jgi:DNA (cytosine-5)-methyltransferase 1